MKDLDSRIAAHAGAYSARTPLWWTVRLRDTGAGVMARDVLAVIASYADNKTGEAFPTIETIAATLGVRRNAAELGIRQLKSAGIAAVIPRNRRKAGRTSTA